MTDATLDEIAGRLKACLVGARHYSPTQRLHDLDTLVTFAREVRREGKRLGKAGRRLKERLKAGRRGKDGETQTDPKDGGEVEGED